MPLTSETRLAAVPSIGSATGIEPPALASGATSSELFQRFAALIFGYCLTQLGSREEAEDAVQMTFLNAFRGLQRGIVPQAESAWLVKFAHHVCRARRADPARGRPRAHA